MSGAAIYDFDAIGKALKDMNEEKKPAPRGEPAIARCHNISSNVPAILRVGDSAFYYAPYVPLFLGTGKETNYNILSEEKRAESREKLRERMKKYYDNRNEP